MEVLKVFFVRETKTFKLKVQWWNIGRCHAPFPMMNIKQTLEIPLAKWSEWEPYTWTKQDPVVHYDFQV